MNRDWSLVFWECSNSFVYDVWVIDKEWAICAVHCASIHWCKSWARISNTVYECSIFQYECLLIRVVAEINSSILSRKLISILLIACVHKLKCRSTIWIESSLHHWSSVRIMVIICILRKCKWNSLYIRKLKARNLYPEMLCNKLHLLVQS
jgi:hypothetical protein